MRWVDACCHKALREKEHSGGGDGQWQQQQFVQSNIFSLTACQLYSFYCRRKKKKWRKTYDNPTTQPSMHPLLKRCQTLCVHPCGEEEEVMSTPKGNGGHQWPAWLPTTPGKSRMESMCLDPHTIAKKKKRGKKKRKKKKQKSLTVSGGVSMKCWAELGWGLRGVGDGGYQTGAPRGTFGEEEPCTMSPATNRCSLIWLWSHE